MLVSITLEGDQRAVYLRPGRTDEFGSDSLNQLRTFEIHEKGFVQIIHLPTRGREESLNNT